MSRPKDENSVSSRVSALEVNGECIIQNKNVASVIVMVSQLKKKEGMGDRKFKIHSKDDMVSIKRIS